MKKLAIIIPYYKIDFFEETIKSVAVQNNRNFVLYIGNDASPDNPLPIIEKYASDFSYHYFDYTENLGGKNLALQWERILDNVQEEWFQILGDDDVIADNFVEEFYKKLPYIEEKSASVVKFSHQWIDEDNQLIKDFEYPFSEITPQDFFLQKYHDEIKSSLSENIFKMAIYKKHKFEKLPLAWGSDDLAILAFANKHNIIYIKDTKVKVRISTKSISGSNNYDELKEKALHQMKSIIITKYSNFFSFDFINKIINQYIYQSYQKGFSFYYPVIFYYLKHLKFTAFLKALKKTYYIYKKNA
ncbi:glycosyltransferase [Chryseobacterium sp. Y16C]|uniref:glycosyltransferase family 2 protein n=1 Tax=Chryseobacterium sp. Y16C TaxID=2920939 RepID=UPI001F0B106B|nr:glycosyltransferase [Chryseobacterium sp. Y16C]UMQ40261.1 glycosyltransferase [Chryseobacterium sp. Y16C]